MRIAGKRIRTTRLLRGGRFVVAVEVEMVIPLDDPGEPCYESETIHFIREIEARARQGDRSWLTQHGQVYELIDQGQRPLAVQRV